MPDGEKILIVGPAWIGDMVMAQSLFRLLHQRDPAVLIDVVGPPWSVPLVARMAEVRRCHPLPAAHGELALGARWRLAGQLRGVQYDRAIVLPRSFKSALVPWLAGVRLRTGFATEMRRWILTDARRLDRSLLDQTVKRFLALGLPQGAMLPEVPQPALRTDAANLAALRVRLGLGAGEAVALMPGAAYGPAKQWPTGHFGELARMLAAAICATAGAGTYNLCGETRLEDTVDLLSAARAAVTNDSGLMHVAAAAGTHVVAIYGSSSPAFTPPLTARRTIHYLGLDCSPCFRRECPLGHLRCLRDIDAARVLASL